MTVLEPIPKSTPSPPCPPETAVPGFLGTDGMRYSVVESRLPEELSQIEEQWQTLSSRSADPNPFYEPWFLIPALRHLGNSQRWHFLQIYRTEAKKPGVPELCGFFPFVESRGPLGLSQWSLWKNQFCFLTSPLVDRNCTSNVLRTTLNFIRDSQSRPVSLELPLVTGEGPLNHGITEVLRENLCTTFLPDQYLRAAANCHGNTEEYFKNALGGHHVREYRRKRRKLEALGQLEYRQIQERRAVDCWIDWFLDLEAQGWKARAGTAIKQHPEESTFFREMIQRGFAAGRVRLEGLFLNGEPIALKCILLSPPVAFAFKIAFDETHHSCSPGVQLEFDSLQHLAADEEITWSDSCAVPGHQMIDRLWTERRLVRRMILSTGTSTGDLAIGALPFLRSLNRVRKRWVEKFSSTFLKTGSIESGERPAS
ncbi:GNAT family N-acetyltransferase [Planctomicrobium sp. SH661]|uniref:GNAT family N-acetyltransferase n=1 Tax=Planctomicrobium sp. SH661 TaxID=3448124 RepID=UPI003F5C2BB7